MVPITLLWVCSWVAEFIRKTLWTGRVVWVRGGGGVRAERKAGKGEGNICDNMNQSSVIDHRTLSMKETQPSSVSGTIQSPDVARKPGGLTLSPKRLKQKNHLRPFCPDWSSWGETKQHPSPERPSPAGLSYGGGRGGGNKPQSDKLLQLLWKESANATMQQQHRTHTCRVCGLPELKGPFDPVDVQRVRQTLSLQLSQQTAKRNNWLLLDTINISVPSVHVAETQTERECEHVRTPARVCARWPIRNVFFCKLWRGKLI